MTNKKQDEAIHSGHRERMREKLKDNGSFPPHELLEMLLTYSLPRINTNELAHKLINRFGSIDAVLSADMDALQEVDGIGEKSALLIHLVSRIYDSLGGPSVSRVTLDSVGKIGRYAVSLFRGMKNEAVFALLLDNELCLIECVHLAGGSSSGVHIDLQKIVKLSAARRSAAVVLLHNHPDGFSEPSEADMEFVARATELFHLMELEVIEHIIVAGDQYRAIMGKNSLL